MVASPDAITAESCIDLLSQYRHIRSLSERYCAPLEHEDYGLQACAETSPAKWHLAHTSWFFETFLLKPFVANYQPYNDRFEYLFNSYYNGIGAQFPRAQRGLLSRPTVSEIYAYRRAVDDAMYLLLASDVVQKTDVLSRITLGLQHEMQHQELFFTDLKYNFSVNPLLPTYQPLTDPWLEPEPPAFEWRAFENGISLIGTTNSESDAHTVFDSFCFDNETPQHRVFLEPFSLANRPLTNAEVLAFIHDGGYQNSALWLADGWQKIQTEHWQHPLYWVQRDNAWFEFTLHGLQPLDPHRTACHLSAYEADALARWMDARLPTEFEWECAAQRYNATHGISETDALTQSLANGHFVDHEHYHPRAANPDTLFGGIWEWTSSAYSPYPGFKTPAGAIGEYNGKFMCNQLVLRGGSCVSDRRQLRASYRNFFYPPDRWQFSGVRLAKDRR